MLGQLPEKIIAQVREATQAGFPTIKVFTTTVQPSARVPENERRTVGMGHLSAVMEQVAAHGGMMFVHSEDDDILQYMYQKLTEEERTEWYNIHEVHNNMSEDLSFRRVIRAAQWTGASVYFVHISAKEGVNAVREARGRGLPVYGETLHNYVSLTAEYYKRPDGMKYHTSPSLKFEEDRQALWDGLLRGGINSMATDEYCTDLRHEGLGEDDPRHQGRPQRRRDPHGDHLQRGCRQEGHAATPLCGRDLDQRGPGHGLLPPQRRHCAGQ